MQLFKREGTQCSPIQSWLAPLESDVQSLLCSNLLPMLGVTLLANEFPAGEGRIDSLGIDESGGPTIIEYKRAKRDGVINQALSYHAWLSSHKEVFERLVATSSTSYSGVIDWSALRVICIASGFSPYDIQAISLFKANIDLVEYAFHGDSIISLNGVAHNRLPGYQSSTKQRPGDSISFYERLMQGSAKTQGFVIAIESLISDAKLPFMLIEERADLVIMATDPVASLSLRGASGRLRCHFMISPDEVLPELDECWHPGIINARRIRHGFELSVFDELSLEAVKKVFSAIASLNDRASCWS